MNIYIYALGAIIIQALLLPGEVFAASQSVTANISFDIPLSITKASDINFGMVQAGRPGTYVISTAGAVTVADGGKHIGGSTQAGSLTVVGSTIQTIDISVNNYAANSGVSPSTATCTYNGGTPAPCALISQTAPGTGMPLLVGISVAVDGTQALGTSAAPSFDVVVNYN